MKVGRISIFICAWIISLVASSCGSSIVAGPTQTPASTSTPLPPTSTPEPTRTFTPIPPTPTEEPEAIAEVQTAEGVAVLTSVERIAAWPQGCDPKANFGDANGCFVVPIDGFELLLITFVPKDPTIEQLQVELDANIYVSTEDGEQFELGSAGHSGDTQMVMFSVPVGTSGFTLYWEDNPPVVLP